MPLSIVSLCAHVCCLAVVARCEDWRQWRGPRGDGTSVEKNLPITWSPSANVAWKVALPEPGNSTPIVWGDRIFLTQPVSKENKRLLMCFDRISGKLLWQSGTQWTEADVTHATNPLCSASPVTDGQRVIAWFGSAGLFCYDLDGREIWRRDLGIQKHIWGYGASPVIHGNLCYLNFGPGERSFLVAVDCQTGQTVWQHDEPINRNGTAEAKFTNADFYGSWSTPVLRKVGDREELLISFPFRLCALDPRSGAELWSSPGINALVYTSPLVKDEMIVTMGGYSGMAMALKVGSTITGQVDPALRMWRHPKTKQRIGSGAIHDGHIFIHNDPGIAECFELTTGKLIWEQRLSGAGTKSTNWSSMFIADGNCYSLTQGGDCFVFRASPKYELLATNALGEVSNSSVIASEGQLLLRTHKHLWCIGK
ncbi:MAG: PQQ-binding-like beta-propeller repeat protein [Pirellulaceae bacterium]|nr:PQQ-binding-like beta-propeller repeat protein [Pirellulaceae bacterium]